MDVEVNDNDAWGAMKKGLISALILWSTRSTDDQSIDCVTIWPLCHLSHCLHSGERYVQWAFRGENWRFNDEFLERTDFGDVLIYDARCI